MQMGCFGVEESTGPRGWLEWEKKLGLKVGKKEWIEPKRRMWAS
jgi:hypothetical protein